MPTFDETRVRHLMRQAFGAGALIEGSHIRWNISGNCTDPAEVKIGGRKARNIREALGEDWKSISRMSPSTAQRYAMRNLDVKSREEAAPWSSLELLVRCRRCDKCRYFRMRLWRFRARAEIAASSRTWFGTLTLRPTEQALALLRAQSKAARGGVVWEELTDAERFSRRVNAISPEITKYLKRVRKQSGAKIRYCLVAEEHKTGLPHFHLLVHEIGDTPVRHEVLKGQWGLGFSNFKLADPTAANYVTKYLTKATRAQIRASLAYGNTASAIEAPRLSLVRQARPSPLSMEDSDARAVGEAPL